MIVEPFGNLDLVVQEFLEAPPGRARVYYTGHLVHDRFPVVVGGTRVDAVRAAKIDLLGEAFWRLYVQGFAFLLQKRTAYATWEYWAIRRARKAKAIDFTRVREPVVDQDPRYSERRSLRVHPLVEKPRPVVSSPVLGSRVPRRLVARQGA